MSNQSTLVPIGDLPIDVSMPEAVLAAYGKEITAIDEALRQNRSVLVECDKDVTLFLMLAIRDRFRRDKANAPRLALVDGRPDPDPNVPYRGNLPRMMEQLMNAVRGSTENTVVVMPYLDVLATTFTGLTVEAREMIPLLYENPEVVILAFRDPSFEVPKIVKDHFTVRFEIVGIPRECLTKIVTQREARSMHATEFDPYGLYKYVSGLNVVTFRKMFQRVGTRREAPQGRPLAQEVYREIRKQTAPADEAEFPNVSLEKDIGGYEPVKTKFREELFDLLEAKNASTDPDKVAKLEKLIPRGIIFYGPPGTGKCVAAGTMIVDAATGIPRKVEDIVRDERTVYAFSLAEGRVVPAQPSAWAHTGDKECVRVRTHVGHEVEVTPEHPVLTGSGWKRAGDLVPGEYIAGASSFPTPIVTVDVPDDDLVLLGSLITDGCYSQKFVTYTKYDAGTVNRVRAAVETMGGTLHAYDPKRPGDYRILTPRENGKSRIRNLLERYGIVPATAHFKHLPEVVFQLNPEKLGVFIGALWSGDGEVDSRRGYLTYGSASRMLVEQLQHLLLRLGVVSNVRFKPVRCDGKTFDFWVLTVCATSRRTFARTVKLFGKKAGLLAGLSFHENPNDDLIPLTPEMRANIGRVYDSYIAEGGSRGVIAGALGRRDFDRFQLLRRNTISKRVFTAFVNATGAEEIRWYANVRWEKVTEVPEVGVRPVYDMCVPEHHNFLANDIVAHNTYFAKALATKINASIIVVSGPELKSKWVGASEENLRRVFRQARATAPCVIVFDEIDSFATQRGTYQGSGVEHSMVNQLLTEMDGFRSNESIFIVATTNFLESVDSALMRPGRFELHIEIPAPSADDRKEIVGLYNKRLNLGMTEPVIKHAVRRTEGYADKVKGVPFAGDHLQALARALSRKLLRSPDGYVLGTGDVDEALQRKLARPIILSPEEERIIAIHEAGHALVSMLLPKATRPERICIAQDQEGALGYVQRAARVRPYAVSSGEFLADIAVAFGGREAERLFVGDVSVGAAQDLQVASQIARAYVGVYGMSDTYGPSVVIDDRPSQAQAAEIDTEVKRILLQEQTVARDILVKHSDLHRALTELLLERKVLEATDITAFHGTHPA